MDIKPWPDQPAQGALGLLLTPLFPLPLVQFHLAAILPFIKSNNYLFLTL